ncbi:MAG: hypothetical protein JNM83_05730 [Myxococcales bacterium]|nr:hypothetical protein [Myxococcales bacterium]
MSDIFEAIEQLSVLLSLRLQNTVRKRGWAEKPTTTRFEVRGVSRSYYPVRVGLALPLGHKASFVPDETPSEDGQSWTIQVKRSDGVSRRSFANGIQVRKVESGYQLFLREEVLGDSQFKRLVEDLAAGGLSGHAMTIWKAYKSRFGSMPAEVYELLFSAQHLEQLELMHEAVLTGVSQLDVETELGRLSKWQPNAPETPEA